MKGGSYWDIDDLLTSQENVQSIADQDIEGINLRENTIGEFGDNCILKEGQTFDMPLWLASIIREGGYSIIREPKYLTDKYYYLLQNDPTFVNIKSKNSYFYEICMKLIPHLDEEEKWPKLLIETIHKRFLYFLRNSTNVVYENHTLGKIISIKEKEFYDKMVKINKNVKFYLENYENNNKNLEEVTEAKKMRKVKKMN